jgi:ribose transport system ATP-binding protein
VDRTSVDSGFASSAEPALEVRGVSKSFARVVVLDDVDLVVRPSSVHALVGHNGSGKSTLIKLLAGYHAPDQANVASSFGKPFGLGDHVAAARAGLRFVHQDLGLVEDLDTVDNLALGPGYPRRPGGTIRWREAARRGRAAMTALGYDIDVTRPVGQLTAAERTGVAIARALQGWSGSPAVVVLDEPTAAMPAPEVQRLLEALRRLRAQGLGIVYVSHHIDEILELADDITVLRNGHVVAARPAEGLSHADLITTIVGRPLSRAAGTNARSSAPASDLPVLQVDELSTDRVRAVSFTVARGEIVGLAGIAGSGRDELLPAIAGARERKGGVRVTGQLVPSRRPHAAIRAGLGFVPADRRRAALFPALDVRANLTISGLERYVRFGLLNQRAETRDAVGRLHELDVHPLKPHAPILTLSGGNQQKIVVDRWLRRQPNVLLLDEPAQGVDIGARQGIYAELQRAAAAGRGVLISSADSDELAAVCDRVLILVHGVIAGELRRPHLDASTIDAVSLGERVEATS